MGELNEPKASITNSAINEQVKRDLQKIYDAEVQQAIEIIDKYPLDLSDFSDFFISCIGESDRSIPVLVLSYIDKRAIELLSRNMNDEIPGGTKSLFDPMGPMGTSAARAKIAFALNWISQSTFRDLEIVRKIRNDFAHLAMHRGFTDRRIVDQIEAMSERQMDIPNDQTTRTKFLLRSAATTARMVQEMICVPVAQEMRVLPHDIMCREMKGLPASLMELRLRLLHIRLNIEGNFCSYNEVCSGKHRSTSHYI